MSSLNTFLNIASGGSLAYIVVNIIIMLVRRTTWRVKRFIRRILWAVSVLAVALLINLFI